MATLKRLGLKVRSLFRSVPDDEPAFCSNDCGVLVAPGEGVRSAGRAFCSEDCSIEQWERTTA